MPSLFSGHKIDGLWGDGLWRVRGCPPAPPAARPNQCLPENEIGA